MVSTVKFSQFANAGTTVSGDVVVGLNSGVNSYFTSPPQFVVNFTNATQPSSPTSGMIGYNTDISAYQYYNGTSWLTVENTSDLLAFIARLAANTVGNGASLVGLQNQSGVSSKTVQNLADSQLIASTDNGTLTNGQFLDSLATGILKSTTGTGALSISAPLTSIDGLSTTANEIIYTTGSNIYATAPITPLARSLLADSTTTAMQSTLGLGSAATQNISFFLQTANNLGDVPIPATARSNLGLGTAATKAATNNAQPNVASTVGSFTVGHVLLAGDTLGTVKDGGSPAGMGTVTNIATGTGLTGGPITTTGSIEFANISNNSILANISGSASEPPIPNTLTAIIDSSISNVQGSILYRNSVNWVALPPGAMGLFLQTQGVSENPEWAALGTSGTVNPGLINQIAWYASTGDAVSGLSTIDNGVLITSASSVPSISTTLPSELTIPSPIINQILDSNGNIVSTFNASASAVNYFGFYNAPSGSNINLYALGSDTNIGVSIVAKGTGSNFISSTGTTPLSINSGTGYQHLTNFIFPTTSAIRNVTFPDASGTVAFTSELFTTFNADSGSATVSANAITISGASNGLTTSGSGSTIDLSLASIASNNILSNITGGSAIPIANTLTAIIDSAIGSTQGDILYRNASGWVVLPPGTAGNVLSTGGSAANPSWISAGGSGITNNGLNAAGQFVISNSTTGAISSTANIWDSVHNNLVMGNATNPSVGTSIVLIGNTALAFSVNCSESVIIGYNAAVEGQNSVSIGSNTFGNGADTVAIGNSANAQAGAAIAIGLSSSANSFAAIAIGNGHAITGQSSIGLGANCTTTGNFSAAFGNTAKATHAGSFVFGDSNGTPQTDSAANQWVCTYAGGYELYVGSTLAFGINSSAIITTGTWEGTPVGLAYGGTNASLTATAGSVPYSTSTAIALSAAGSTGQLFLSGGTGSPTWSSTNIALTTPQITTGIKDSNGNLILGLTATTSAVNYFQMSDSSTGNAIGLSAAGSDTNIIMSLAGKGTGGVQIGGTSAANNASAGYVGEVITSNIPSASATTMGSNSATNVTSISLTAGDWDVFGNVSFTSLGTAPSGYFGWVSTSSATLPDASLRSGVNFSVAPSFAVNNGVTCPVLRVNVSSTTPVYLSGYIGNSSGSGGACGTIYARRVR